MTEPSAIATDGTPDFPAGKSPNTPEQINAEIAVAASHLFVFMCFTWNVFGSFPASAVTLCLLLNALVGAH